MSKESNQSNAYQSNSQIKIFISAIVMLIILWIATGLLTYILPSGTYDGVFIASETKGIPFLKWLGAPILVLFSDSGALVIAIILFLLIIGGAIYLLKMSGLIEGVILKIAGRFKSNSRVLMGILILFFMGLGAFVGVFEEVVPLAPLVILLGRQMGWDDLTGLGVTVLACGLGFSAAITNPFTIGVAQQLADLPVFSGALYRVLVFISVYTILYAYLLRHVKKTKVLQIDDQPDNIDLKGKVPQKAYMLFIGIMGFMMIYVMLSPFIEILRDLSLVVIAFSFLVAALGVGFMTMEGKRLVFKTFIKGALDMSPAIVLILLATSIKYILIEGQILDTILYYMVLTLSDMPPIYAIYGAFLLVMVLNFFIGSGSAKAFILIPILMPLLDILGIGRQLGILAFQFGDGFSNILYPTNAVLLISLGLTQISYTKWLRFILPLQGILFLVSIIWLSLGFFLGY